VERLRHLKGGSIGLVNTCHIPKGFFDHVRTHLTDTTFVDATDLVDEIKAVKSQEELVLIRKTATLQDAAFKEAIKLIEPGVRDHEIMAQAQYVCEMLGSEQQLIMSGSAPMGTPAPMRKRHFMNRKIQQGDQMTVMIEANGPGGYYTELGRTCVLGKASDELLQACDIAKEAQQVTLKLLKQGADPKELVAANNDFLRDRGFPEERRLYAHGQGYDLVERPAIREDEPMMLRNNMNITVHPIVATKSVFTWICDNYIVTENGASECLHATEKKIFEL
jgi:Xaa-Pro aminopeptidase